MVRALDGAEMVRTHGVDPVDKLVMSSLVVKMMIASVAVLA